MGSLTTSFIIYCLCDGEYNDYVAYFSDWHSETVKLKCPKCGHEIEVQRSFGTEDKITEGSGRD